MIGLVNKAIEQMVLERFGQETWDEIREQAGWKDTFVSMEGYSDTITFELVMAASEILDTTPEELLEAFGEHWIRYTADEGYGEMMSMYGDSVFEFLGNLNNLHAQIRLTMPELKPPVITCREETNGRLRVTYESDRHGLAPMMIGLLRGLGERFDTPVDVEHVVQRNSHMDHDEFIVTYRQARAA